jgi:Holliday junction resolvase RusA-like endonuclease
MIKFVVYGEAVAQGRPRFARRGDFVQTYDPEKSRNYKSMVRLEALKVKPEKPLEGPLSLVLYIYKSIPKSFSKKRYLDAVNGIIKPTTKPDIDNVIKGIKDALKAVVWRDDSQIVRIMAIKKYDEVPRIEVIIGEIEEDIISV